MTSQRGTRALVVTVVPLVALGVLAGCGGEPTEPEGDPPATTPAPTAPTSPPATPTASPSSTQSGAPQEGVVIDATIRGDDLMPNGERVKAELGEPIVINVDADRDGELHVHSIPEQTLTYRQGRTTLRIVIDTPGVVEVEDHVADKLLVSLEVS